MRALVALLTLLGIAGCIDITDSKQRPSPTVPLRVGTSGDYPPFSVRTSDGALSGFDVAVAEAYARDQRRAVEWVTFRWPDLERRFGAGDFDVVMSGVTVRGERLALAPMTAAVARASAVLVVPAARASPTPADGSGLTVAVNRGGHLERVARSRLPRARIVTLDDNRSLPATLASGDVDGVVTDSLELQSFAAPGGPPPRVALVLSEDRKAYWVAPGANTLAASLDAWLAVREDDGTLARLRAEHLGAASDPARGQAADGAALRVVDLVARRLLLMPEVAEAKRAAGLPVEVPAREGEVYERARAAAERGGLAAAPYVELVRAQVEAAKAVQVAVLAQLGPTTPPDADAAARARNRLDHQLRPAIDRLDEAIRGALVRSAPLRMPVDRLAAALERDAALPGFNARQAALLADALARIPAALRE